MPTLHLLLLGPPRVELEHQPVEIPSRKAVALLAYLAITGQPHSREHLAALLWPQADTEHARGALRAALAALRRAVGDTWIVAEGDTLSLGSGDRDQESEDRRIELDVARFRADLVAVRAHLHAAHAPCPECQARLATATDLYRGDFLTGFSISNAADFDLWQTCQGETLRLELAEALERLAENCSACGHPGRALTAARRWLALDPMCESAHRCLMRLYAAAGERRAALLQYTTCREVLTKELGIAPEAETLALYEDIKAARSLAAGATSTTANRQAPRPRVAAPSGAFFGRDKEFGQVGQCLADPACRMLTILGVGGVGKTILARHAAAAYADLFRDGACFVPLASIRAADLMPSTIVQALNLPPSAGIEPQRQLCDYLRDRQMLLVLDNFEHLLEHDSKGPIGAEWLPTLLSAAPGLKLLITSRERLDLHDEWLLPLRGLPLPPNMATKFGKLFGEIEGEDTSLDLAAYAATQLFLHCARRVGFDLQPDADQSRLIAHICRLADGLPLAIELIAMWVRVLPLAEIAARLEAGLDLLATIERDVPQRHRSMRAAFDYSWGLLSVRERSILRQLAVFRSSFTAEAAHAVANSSLLDLAGLVDKSWLQAESTGRYALLELIGQYCSEKLAGDHAEMAGENIDAVRDRHNAYYISLLDRQPQAQSTWEDQHLSLFYDLDNLREIWPRAIERGDQHTMLRLLGLLSSFDVSPRLSIPMVESAIRKLEAICASTSNSMFRQESIIFLTRLQCSLARLNIRQGHLTRATSCIQVGQDLLVQAPRSGGWEEADFHLRREHALLTLNQGLFYAAFRETQGLLTYLPEVHAQLWPYQPDRSLSYWQAELSAMLFWPLHRLGRYDEAQRTVEDALQWFAQMPWACNSQALANLGQLHCLRGEFGEGLRLAGESLRSNQAHQQRAHSAASLLALAEAEVGLGRMPEAHEHLRQAIAVSRAYEYVAYLMRSMVALSRLELRLGRPAKAKELCEEARALFQQLGLEWENISAMISIGLGWATLPLLGPPAAEAHFVRALRCRAHEAHDTMDAIAGLAQTSADAGNTVRTAELAAFVADHPATAHTIRHEVSSLLRKLEPELTIEAFNVAVERGQTSELDMVLTRITEGYSAGTCRPTRETSLTTS